jgi:hypothetical protein
MKWFLISMIIWDGGSYALNPPGGASFDTEQQCLEQIKLYNHMPLNSDEPGISHGFICMRTIEWPKFTFNDRRN